MKGSELIEFIQKNNLLDKEFKVYKEGYYVAVLNSWLCPLCYAKWKKHATRYSEDVPVEERNYRRYKELISEVEKSSLYNYSGS
jgi:hypothetical protein